MPQKTSWPPPPLVVVVQVANMYVVGLNKIPHTFQQKNIVVLALSVAGCSTHVVAMAVCRW